MAPFSYFSPFLMGFKVCGYPRSWPMHKGLEKAPHMSRQFSMEKCKSIGEKSIKKAGGHSMVLTVLQMLMSYNILLEVLKN